MQLNITSRALDFFKTELKQITLKEKALFFILKLLEKYFGTDLLIKIPPAIAGLENQTPKTIETAHRLQSLGVLKSVIKILPLPDEPFIHFYRAFSTDKKANGLGLDFFQENAAVWRAMAETTERYLWFKADAFYQDAIFAPYQDVKNQALDIFSLAGFSAEQKRNNPLLQFDEKTILGWTWTKSLTSGKKILCPIQLISGRYAGKEVRSRPEENKEPLLRWCVSTGLATGQNLTETILKGLLETIERDAFMISYLNKLSPPVADLKYLAEQDEQIAKIVESTKRYNFELYLLLLPTDFPVFVNLALTIDQTGLGPAVTVGAAANFDFKTGFLAACAESLAGRYLFRVPPPREKNSSLPDHIERLRPWADKASIKKIDFFLRGRKEKIDLAKISSDKSQTQNKLALLVNELKKKKYEACYVELTTPEIKKTGLRCAQVVVPQLQPLNLNDSIPYFGGSRLKEVPKKLGYNPAEILNTEPHPFP